MRSRKPEQVTLLPDPPRARPGASPSSRPTTTWSSRRSMFDGRLPAKFAEQAPRRRRRRRAVARPGSTTGSVNPQIGLAAVAGRPIEECSYEPVRFDEMRRGDYDVDARVRDMDLDGVYASVCFPSAMPGLLRSSPAARRERSRARAGGRAGVERLASRRLGRRAPRPLHALPDPVAARSRGRGRGGPPQRGAWASRRSRSARTPSHWACRRSTPATGIRCSPRARRPRPSCACTSGRRAPRPPRRATRRATASACCSSASRCSPRSTGSTRRSRCASRTSRSALRGRRRLGRGTARPPRPRRQVPGRLRHVGGHRPHAARGDAAQLLVLLARGRRRVRRARPHRVRTRDVETDYPHLDGTWPDSQEILWRQIGKLPRCRPAEKIAWRNAVGAVPSPGARRRRRRSRAKW